MPSNQSNINIGVKYNVDQASVNAVKKSLQDLQNIKPADFKGTKKELDQIKDTAKQVEAALEQAFNVNLGSLNVNSFNAQLKTAGLSVNQIYNLFSKAGVTGTNAFRNMTSSVLTTNLQLKLTKSLITSMGETMANTVKWGIASSVMNNFTQSVQQAFQYAKSLDAALTDIRIVTGDSTLQMRQFAQLANKASQNLGRSTMDYTKAALSFYQQGLSDELVKTRTLTVLKAQNITGAGLEMADYLTAVWNGYKVANLLAELYVDKLAAVADSSASNMSLLAVAMSKVASAANNLGVPVDSLNAQIATITATTRQAPETVGNALKTIYARINDIKTGADDALISLGNYSGAMAKLGFNVLDANGNLRDTGDVLEEIGGKWETLSREQQIYLARTMAGQRQYNNLVSLFDNWGKYTDLLNVSMLAQGTTMEKNSRYMESLGAKLEQLGAAGLRVKDALIDELDLKGLALLGTGITNLFASFVESIGGGKNALLALGGVVTSVFGSTISKLLGTVILNFQQARENAQRLSQEIENTRLLGLSQGYSDGVITKTVDSMRLIQQYYSSMSASQIESYQNLVRQSAEQLNNLDILRRLQTVVLNFEASVARAGQQFGKDFSDQILTAVGVTLDLQNTLNGLTVPQLSSDQQVFDELVTNVKLLLLTVGENAVPAFLKFDNILNQIQSQTAPATNDQLRTLRAYAQAALSQVNNLLGKDLDEIKAKAGEASSKFNDLENARQRVLQEAKANSLGQNLTAYISSLTQILNVINNISRIGSVLNNDSLSQGEKIRQIITNLVFSLGMAVSAYNKITAVMGIQQLAADKRWLTEKKVTLEKERQLLLETKSALLNSKPAGNRSNGNKEFLEWAKQIGQVNQQIANTDSQIANVGTQLGGLGSIGSLVGGKLSAAFSSFAGILSGPVGIAAGIVGLTALIGVGLYKAYNKAKDAAKEAEKVRTEAKLQYDNIKESVSSLNSSLNNLASARLNLNNLSEGTKEWNTALQDVNKQVLLLTENFPELKKFLDSDNGILGFKEGALEYVQGIYRQRLFASGLSYAATDRLSTLATNRSLIVDAGRNLFGDLLGLLGLSADSLLEVVNAIHLHGDWILENSQTLSNFTSLEEREIDAVLAHREAVNELAILTQNNTAASLNLTNAIVQNLLFNVSLYQNSSNKLLFAAMVEDVYKNATLNQSYYKTTATGLQTDIVDTKAIALRWAESLGLTYGETIRVRWGKILHLIDGQWKKVSQDMVETAVAQYDALQDIDDYYTTITDTINNLGDRGSEIYSAFKSGTAGSQLSQDDIQYIRLNGDKFTSLILHTLFGDNDYNLELDKYSQDIQKNVLKYVNGFPVSVKNAFDAITNGRLDSISAEATQAIGSILTKAFGEGGGLILTLFEDIFKGIKTLDLLPFELLLSSVGTNTSLEEFKILAADAGILLDNSNPKLASFVEYLNSIAEVEIPNPEEFYKSIHDIINGIDIGDTITAEQGATLELAGILLSKYFDRFPDGTLKLRLSVLEFVNEANNISLQPLVDKLNSLSELVALKSNFENSKYSASNGLDFQSFSSSALGALHFSAQLAFLQAIDQLTPLISAKVRDLSLQLVNWNNLTKEQKNLLNEVAEQVLINQGSWLENASAIDTANNSIAQYAELLGNATKTFETLDLDVDEDQWQELSEYLRDYATVLDEVSDDVQDNAEISDELAESLLRYDNALAEVILHEDEWGEMLSSGAIQDRIEAGNELQDVYSDLLDLPFESLSPDFTQDISNFNLLKQAINGDEDAYNQLAEAARQDIALQAHFDDTEFQNGFNNLLSQYYEAENLDDLLIGAALDNQQFLDALSDMVTAAGMTAEQATDYLASMGVDAEVTENNSPTTLTKETSGWTTTLLPVTLVGTVPTMAGPFGLPVQVPIMYRTYQAVYSPQMETVETQSDNKAVSLKVTSAHKSSGGGFKHKNASHGGGSSRPKSKNKGGGGGGGGKGKAPTPATKAKVNTTKIDTKQKTPDHNPYLQLLKSYDRQSKKLDELQDKLKKLVNKDRLKNLQQQNKVLEKQKKILLDELDISANKAALNSTANYANRLRQAFGKTLKFDKDGQISNINALLKKNAEMYNKSAQDAEDTFKKAQENYNNYIENTWNKYATKDLQLKHKALKLLWDLKIKQAELKAKNDIKNAEDVYKANEELIKLYNKAWEDDLKRRELIKKAQEEILENQIEISKIKVDLSIDSGNLERDWLEFENKFIKKLDKNDFLGSAKASAKELMSYFDSKQIQKTSDQIKKIRNEIAKMLAGGVSSIYSVVDEQGNIVAQNLKQAQEDLDEYTKQLMGDLSDVQDLVDAIKLNYLDAIDDAKDKMDNQIDQYERINDLVEHNVKMTLLLYGDKAYATLDKWYNIQQKNDQKLLDSLRRQQQYWQQKMNNEVVGSDAWKKFKENLDDSVDQLNNKLEDMLDNLHKKWLNKVDGIIEKLNNGLTNGRGLDFLDEQWDYINNYDDKFLDTFETKTGVLDVERLYQSTIDGLAGSPKSQQKLNKLMNDQLKLLREKDHLTQYDLDRAKASLEVEKARLALEEARDNKTKMRLRRDSQGNYTYQYVADEEKLGDLQAALADAQANLYNTDKLHYKQNLNDLYDTYKNYIEQMRDLTEEYNNTQDEEERKRIKNRMDLLKESTAKLMSGLTEDNKYLLQYLNGSFFDGMGTDTSALTMEEQMLIMKLNIPQMSSLIQDLSNKIVAEGGILPATAKAMEEINKATVQYDKDVKSFLSTAGTSTDNISKGFDQNINNAQKLITANDELIKSCDSQIKAMLQLLDYMDKYLNKVMNVEQVVGRLMNSYNTLQGLNGNNLTATQENIEDYGLDTTKGMEYTGNPASDAAAIKRQIDALMSQYLKFLTDMSIAKFDTGGYTGNWGDAEGRLAFLHQGELVLNQDDTLNILNAVQLVRSMASAINSFANGEINSLTSGVTGMLGGISSTEQLDQNVHIEANFPNVMQHTEIELAFRNLVNMASMKASGYRD